MEKPPNGASAPDDPSIEDNSRAPLKMVGHEPAEGQTEKPSVSANPVVLSHNETSKIPKDEVEKDDEQNEDSSPDYSSKAKNKTSFKNYLVLALSPRTRLPS